MNTPNDEVERFIATGEHDPRFAAWGGSLSERRRTGAAALKDVLRRIVGYRSARGVGSGRVPPDVDAQVRHRVTPLLRGLFARPEADRLLDVLPSRVHVVTPLTFGTLLEDVGPGTAWDLANLLLDDIGAPPLSDDTPQLDGLANAGHAWLLPRAFAEARPYSDVVVHEVAHLLHGIRREELDWSPPTAPVLAVPPRRRETFAYACEVWACIAREPAEARHAHLTTFRFGFAPDDARVSRSHLDALLDAAAACPDGGWPVIGAWAVR